jgi:hypothetical protein
MIRKTLAAAFILTAAAAAAPLAGAAPTTGVRCASNEDRVWVYESLVDFNVQTKLKCGEQVEVIDRVKGYVKIRTTGGDEGFVNDTAFLKSAIPPEPEDKSQDLQTVSQRALATARAHNTIDASATPTVAATSTPAPAPAAVATQPTPTRVATPAPTPAAAAVTQPTVVAAAKPAPAPVVTAVATPAPTPAPVIKPAPPTVAVAPAPQPVAVATVTPQPAPTPAAQPVVVAAATPTPAPAATKPAKSKPVVQPAPKPAPAPAVVAVSTPAPAPVVAAATPAPQPGQVSIVDVTPLPSNSAPVATTVTVAAHKANSDEDDEDNTPAVDASLANCSTYFVAYGLSPNQYKWIQQNRTKAFPSVCPAPTQAQVDYIVIFTHDVDFYNVTMPTAVHQEQNGFSDWAPLSTVDDALMSRSDANKSHHEYVWVFHTHRGAYEPTSFSAHRKPIFSKDETNMLGSHGGFRTVMDALTYIEGNPSGTH